MLWAATPDDHGKWQLLDGRNRLDAAELAGIQVVSIRTDKGGRVDINVPHRHLYGQTAVGLPSMGRARWPIPTSTSSPPTCTAAI